ncbi:hypothetical protein CQW49_22595 (plasmid) [Methylosinus trichosporium OB3b]|uniref:Uncharacterized protein n=1 Tax=Methylosinus trichosporium (strain ATCC 35070 / NCIMB 11131 / UNIQEM 75 / OB3b) TaxID=595536 RepID=A0A2D2D745_METT3|nr:hypothetical protein CQW49_22595 [Methylosinus trichosporium OB3b]
MKFLADDCPRSGFTDRLYVRLSNSFGNIAHHDRRGFFEHYFLAFETKAEFIEQTLKWPCYGSAEFTFCDVEIVVQSRITTASLLAIVKAQRDSDIARREREQLARLKAKYEPIPRPDALSGLASPATAPEPPTMLRQGSLFDFSE